jgi:hypothetical protein
MKLEYRTLMKKLNKAGLTDEKGEVISFGRFKKMVDIHQYGNGKKRLFILYVGTRDNKFGFYPPTDTKPEMLKIAYSYLVDTVTTELKQEYMFKNIQWGNKGIPLVYSDLRGVLKISI